MPGGQLQTTSTSEEVPISFTSNICKGRSQQAPNSAEANSASCGERLHSGLYAGIGSVQQSASLRADPMHEQVNNNQDSITIGSQYSPQKNPFLEHPAKIKKAGPRKMSNTT